MSNYDISSKPSQKKAQKNQSVWHRNITNIAHLFYDKSQ